MADSSGGLHSFLAEKGLRIENDSVKGRCLVASRDFARGDVLLLQEPYASVLDGKSLSKRCDSCFQLCMNLKRCSVCKVTWYCSSSCQKTEWSIHQHECQALVNLKEKKHQLATPTLRLMLRLLIKRELQNKEKILKTSTDNYSLVEQLPSHMSDINENQLIMYAQMANLMNIIKPSEDISLKEIAANFSRFSCNAHTICDEELRPLGTGLYPVVSIINHSCLPNTVLLFEGRKAIVHAIEPIKEATELTLAYIEIAASTMSRRKVLQEQYLFTCKCPRCCKVDIPDGLHEDAILEGFRCPDEKCEGLLLHGSENSQLLVCHSCGYQSNEEVIKKQAKLIGKKEKEAAKVLSDGNSYKAKALYEDIEKLQSLLWHRYSVYLMRTRDTLLKICMDLQDWKEALNYCRLTIPAYERAYPSFHPMKGLQYFTCGKLEWFLENTMEALKYLKKSIEILVVTHGRDSKIVKELYNMIQEAHAEASHLNAVDHDNL